MISKFAANGALVGLALLSAGVTSWVWTQPPGGTQRILRAEANPPSGEAPAPDEWIRDFDRRCERLIDRLDGRMETLRRRLERHHRGPSLLAKCG